MEESRECILIFTLLRAPAGAAGDSEYNEHSIEKTRACILTFTQLRAAGAECDSEIG